MVKCYLTPHGYLDTKHLSHILHIALITLNCASLPVPPAGLEAGVELLMIVCVGRKLFIILIH